MMNQNRFLAIIAMSFITASAQATDLQGRVSGLETEVGAIRSDFAPAIDNKADVAALKEVKTRVKALEAKLGQLRNASYVNAGNNAQAIADTTQALNDLKATVAQKAHASAVHALETEVGAIRSDFFSALEGKASTAEVKALVDSMRADFVTQEILTSGALDALSNDLIAQQILVEDALSNIRADAGANTQAIAAADQAIAELRATLDLKQQAFIEKINNVDARFAQQAKDVYHMFNIMLNAQLHTIAALAAEQPAMISAAVAAAAPAAAQAALKSAALSPKILGAAGVVGAGFFVAAKKAHKRMCGDIADMQHALRDQQEVIAQQNAQLNVQAAQMNEQQALTQQQNAKLQELTQELTQHKNATVSAAQGNVALATTGAVAGAAAVVAGSVWLYSAYFNNDSQDNVEQAA